MTFDQLPTLRDVPSVSAAQMAEVDRTAIAELGIPAELLMENASVQIARAARALLGGRVAGRRIVGLIGGGNNGGDAVAALRHLASWGASVTAELAARDRMHGLASVQTTRLAATAGARTAVLHDAAAGGPQTLRADLILDGLLGYSARGAPRGLLPALIDAANGSPTPILAVDIPSGLDPDTGDAAGAVIRAAATVTLALPKTGLLSPGAAPATGTVLIADIGIPHAAFARIGIRTDEIFYDGDLVRIAR